MIDITTPLAKEFNHYGYKIPTNTVGYMKLKIVSLLVPQVRAMLPKLDKEFRLDNS